MLNNHVVQLKNNDAAIHNYCIMHILKIMHGCIIVFKLDYIIIQHGCLFKKRSISLCNLSACSSAYIGVIIVFEKWTIRLLYV